MNINVTFDQAIGTLPAGFVDAVDYVVSLYDALFTNNVTVNIDVGYGEVNGQALATDSLGQSSSYISSYSYLQVLAALESNETSATQTAAYATLPATLPVSGGTIWMTTAEGKALGLVAANNPAIDGYVGFSSQYSFSYSPTATPASNQFYFVGVVEHEFSEVLGRISGLGAGWGGSTSYTPMDLFRYSAPGVRDTTAAPPSPYTGAYFSINDGLTDLDDWNPNISAGDLGDWASTAGNDAFLAATPPGQIDGLASTDVTLMNVLGWDVSSSTATPVTSPSPSPVVSSGSIVVISAGQISSGLTVLSGGEVIVLSGGQALDISVAGGTEIVFHGGVTAATVVSHGGELIVEGLAADISVAGGTEFVRAGGSDNGTVVSSGGAEILLVGGTANDAMVSSGGYMLVSSGGVAGGTAVLSGGIEVVFQGGEATGTTVSSGGADYDFGSTSFVNIAGGGGQLVESGGVASATLVQGVQEVFGSSISALISGGGLAILSGGIAIGSLLKSGEMVVEAGGTASGTTVSSGSLEVVSSGGAVTRTTVLSGGAEFDFGSASFVSIASGAGQLVESGGIAIDAIIQGVQEVYGSSIDTTLVSGGKLILLSGGIADGSLLSGGEMLIEAGGTANGTTIGAGALQVVSSGGVTNATNVESDATQYVYGSGAGEIVGGVQYVEIGGSDIGSLVAGTQYVDGSTSDDSVQTGGQVIVASGARISGLRVATGGSADVASGGVAFGTDIVGGILEIADGSGLSGAVTFEGRGGTLRIDDGTLPTAVISGIAVGDTIDLAGVGFASGGSVALQAGGIVTIIENGSSYQLQLDSSQNFSHEFFQLVADGTGGTELEVTDGITQVSAGQTVSRVSVASGYTLDVLSGGEADASSVLSGGTVEVDSGGVAVGTIVSSGGKEYVGSGGLASGAIIGGVQYNYGATSVDSVQFGGVDYVYGSASSVSVASGGTVCVHGSSVDDVIESGGIEYVESGGLVSGALVGGTQYLYGSATNEGAQNGGVIAVEDGGSVSGLQINGGGVVDVMSGGAGAGVIIDGGVLEINSGGTVGDVTFAASASGLLQLDGSQLFNGTIAGFDPSDSLDLSDIGFNPATSTLGFAQSANGLGGTLTVSDGTHLASLALLGQYIAAQFSMASDGHGGTLVTDPSALAAAGQGSSMLAAAHP